MTRRARSSLAMALGAAVLCGCGSPGPAEATLAVSTVGHPDLISFGGTRIEARLMADGVVVGTWEPAPGRTVTIAPGAYIVVIRITPLSDLITCVDSGAGGVSQCAREEGPTKELCRLTVSLEPGSDTRLPIDLGSGPVCDLGPA